eukprot:m.132697 g.132697  ORF g.132697 m.132697 type:complete len:554 (+) comp15782_c1_seq1:143-1804(+)
MGIKVSKGRAERQQKLKEMQEAVKTPEENKEAAERSKGKALAREDGGPANSTRSSLSSSLSDGLSQNSIDLLAQGSSPLIRTPSTSRSGSEPDTRSRNTSSRRNSGDDSDDEADDRGGDESLVNLVGSDQPILPTSREEAVKFWTNLIKEQKELTLGEPPTEETYPLETYLAFQRYYDGLFAIRQETLVPQFPLYAVPLSALRSMRTFTQFETLKAEDKLINITALDPEARRRYFVIFCSHQWCDFDHPDRSGRQMDVLRTYAENRQAGFKFKVEKELKRIDKDIWLRKKLRELAQEREVCVWMDFSSFPQDPSATTEQGLAVQSLCAYVTLCDDFVAITPEVTGDQGRVFDQGSYVTRGWCTAELLACACTGKAAVATADGDSLARVGGGGAMYTRVGASAITVMAPVNNMESLYPLEKQFTCCARNHWGNTRLCDKQRLQTAILGCFAVAVTRQIALGGLEEDDQQTVRPNVDFLDNHYIKDPFIGTGITRELHAGLDRLLPMEHCREARQQLQQRCGRFEHWIDVSSFLVASSRGGLILHEKQRSLNPWH